MEKALEYASKFNVLKGMPFRALFVVRNAFFQKHVINENCPCDENLVKHDKKNSPGRLRHLSGRGAKLREHKENPEPTL